MFRIASRIPLGILCIGLLSWVATPLVGQDKDKAEAKSDKKAATIEVLIPKVKVELKIEGEATKSKESEKRVFVTPLLEPGKTYIYKIETVIEPNNYTKIMRNREVTFKAGDTISVDLRSEDKKYPDDVRIRFVPTPEDIVLEMGKLAKIGKDDVVYDLGCGDGIMICTAVKKMGAKKGVGIDIDPDRVTDAKKSAKDMDISDKIEIRQGNILKLEKKDLTDCTVVMLYLADEMNLRLRPTLWEHLKPGTRIVSHRFIMGDWEPEKTLNVMGADGDEYTIHLWTITGKEKDPKKDDKKKDEPKKDEKKKDEKK